MTQQQYYYGTGRRKTAIARVRVYNTPGGSTVNGKPVDEVFTVGAWLRQAISPLQATNMADKVTVVAKTHGGDRPARLARLPTVSPVPSSSWTKTTRTRSGPPAS